MIVGVGRASRLDQSSVGSGCRRPDGTRGRKERRLWLFKASSQQAGGPQWISRVGVSGGKQSRGAFREERGRAHRWELRREIELKEEGQE